MTATIIVIKASNLPRTDGLGKIDSYFVLKHGSTRLKTKAVQDNLNPIFNETFSFQIGPTQPTSICVELWDEVYWSFFNLMFLKGCWKGRTCWIFYN
jgi:Ca2+-dependent lipid-binding protein